MGGEIERGSPPALPSLDGLGGVGPTSARPLSQQAICALSCVVPFAVAVSGRAQEGNCKDNQRQKDGKNAATI